MDDKAALFLSNRLNKCEILLASVIANLLADAYDEILPPDVRDGIDDYATQYDIDWDEIYEDFMSDTGW